MMGTARNSSIDSSGSGCFPILTVSVSSEKSSMSPRKTSEFARWRSLSFMTDLTRMDMGRILFLEPTQRVWGL